MSQKSAGFTDNGGRTLILRVFANRLLSTLVINVVMLQSDFLVWQLMDTAYPTGGFAHSLGLEAAFQMADINSSTLSSFIKQTLINQCTSTLPFVRGMSSIEFFIFIYLSFLIYLFFSYF